MTLAKFLTTLAVFFGFIASIYFVLGVLKMSPQMIDGLSTTKWNRNLDILNGLCLQKADVLVGIFFLFGALLSQLMSQLSIFNFINVSKSMSISLSCLIGTVLIIAIISYGVHQSIGENTQLETGKHILHKEITGLMTDGKILDAKQIKEIESKASQLIYFKRVNNEDDVAYIERLLKELEIAVPINKGGS